MSSTSFADSAYSNLDSRVRRVGQRSERLLLCYGISRFLSVLLIAGFACGLADYLFRFQERGVRLIVSASLVVVVAAAFVRYVRPVWRFQITNLAVAARIEGRFPELRETLSSAISFLSGQGRGGVSDELQRLVITDASQQIDRLDLMECLDSRVPQRAAVATLLILAAVAGICYSNTDHSFLAARRMLMPWSEDAWPRWNTLSFQSPPRKLAAGADFEAELIDLAGHLPDQVTIQYWFAGTFESRVESRTMKRVAGRMIDRYSNVGRSFKYRAFGGDDDTMPWMQVDLVQPPRIDELRIDVQPPAYTQLPLQTFGREIRALEGSSITVNGRVNKPIGSVEISCDLAGDVSTWTAAITADQESFVFPSDGQPFVAVDSGTMLIQVFDEDGISAIEPLLCELQVVPDSVPTVSISSPSDEAVFLRAARVPLHLVVHDDLKIDAVQLRVGEDFVSLIRDADAAETSQGDTRSIHYEWRLESLPSLSVGDEVEFEVVASDFRPQIGSSGVRRLTIASSDELTRRLAGRRTRLRESILDILGVQRSANRQLAALRPRLSDIGDWQQEDLDAAQAVEFNQRHVSRLSLEGRSSLAGSLERLLQDIASNGLDGDLRSEELKILLEDLRESERLELRPAEDRLGQAVRLARRAHGTIDSASLARMLEESSRLQIAVIDRFEQMSESLAQQRNVRDVEMMLANLQDGQWQVSDATRTSPTIGRDRRQLSARERTNLGLLADQQRALAKQLSQMLSAIETLAGRTATTQPRTAAVMQETLQTARSHTIDGMLREAGRSIEQNRIGMAVSQQQRVEEALGKMAVVLGSNSHSVGLESQAAESLDRRQLQESLVGLRTEQLLLADGVHELASAVSPLELPSSPYRPLAKQQRLLGERVVALLQHLARRPTLTFLLEQVGAEMEIAADRVASEDVSPGTERIQRDAARRLQMAIGVATADRDATEPIRASDGQGSEQSSAANPSLDLRELRLLRAMQEDVNRRTAEYAALGAENGSDQLQNLAAEQAWLANRVKELAK